MKLPLEKGDGREERRGREVGGGGGILCVGLPEKWALGRLQKHHREFLVYRPFTFGG